MGGDGPLFGSVREFLGTIFAARLGPRPPSCPLGRAGEGPRGARRHSEDDIVFGQSVLYGQGKQCFGLEAGSALEQTLQHYATKQLPWHALGARGQAAYHRLSRLLRRHGMIRRSRPPEIEVVTAVSATTLPGLEDLGAFVTFREAQEKS